MKNLLLLLLPFLLFSCSAEEESSNPIVDSWQYWGIIEFTEDGVGIEMQHNECAEKSTLTFSNNGNLKEVSYAVNYLGECTLNEMATNDNLSWEEISEGKYRIFSEIRTSGTVYEVSFPDNNTMWMISGGSYERDGVRYKHRAYVHKRI